MKKLKLLTLAMFVIATAAFTSCKKSESVEPAPNTISGTKKKINGIIDNVYISNAGIAEYIDGSNNYEQVKIYHSNTSKNIRIFLYTTYNGRGWVVGPSFVDFTLSQDPQLWDLSAAYTQTPLRHPGATGLFTDTFHWTVTQIWDMDTNTDITSQVNVTPANGIDVSVTANLLTAWDGKCDNCDIAGLPPI